MVKNNGKKISIYLPDEKHQLLKRLSTASGDSISKIITNAVTHESIMQHENLRISEGAYLAMSIGRFDLLENLSLDNGMTIVTVAESAFKEKGGARGILADARDKLRQHLDANTIYEVIVETSPDFLDDLSKVFKSKYFMDQEKARDYMHEKFEQLMAQLNMSDKSRENTDDAVVCLDDDPAVIITIHERML